MIFLSYSNRTEALLEALGESLAARRRSGISPLEPVALVVPNRNVETWVRHQLARRDGIAAGLQISFLRSWLGRLVQTQVQGARLVDADLLRDGVLSLLLDDAYLRRPELGRVRTYLFGAGAAPDAVDLRRVQLARELATLFEEYGFSRPEMVRAWPKGPCLGETGFAEAERWQRQIWLDLVGPEGMLTRRARDSGERLVPIAEAADHLGLVRLPAPVYIFGVSYVATVFKRILAAVARTSELHIFTLNPCGEFWDDVPAGWELKRPALGLGRRGARIGETALLEHPEDPFGLGSAEGPSLLNRWGRPGRENIRLLNELAECDFSSPFVDPWKDGGTLLEKVQSDILGLTPEAPLPSPRAEDRSIQVLACPGIRREAEVIAGEIWSLVRADEGRPYDTPPLRFSDVAVLVAAKDPEAYFTQLAAAFTETYGLPFDFLDWASPPEHRVAEAVQMLVDLPQGRFTRAEVLRVVTHPAIASRYPAASVAAWASWTEQLGVVHGASHDDHAATYIEQDILNWDQGLRRLALGAAMPGERSGGDGAFELDGRRYLPEEIGGSGEGGPAEFGLLVRSLLADARFARTSRMTLERWGEFFAALAEAYVDTGTDAQEGELARCVHALRALGRIRLEDREISFRVARELATEALAGVRGDAAGEERKGVALATMQPMRALPFRVVFVAGLNEGDFPAADRRSHLDLRAASPLPGDVSPRERDQYLFLETLLCARERIYFSYLARNEMTGDRLEPSPVLAELLRTLTRGYLGSLPSDDAERLLVREHRLRRYDGAYFPSLFPATVPGEQRPVLDPVAASAAPEAWAEARTLRLRQEIEGTLGAGTAPALARLRAALAPEARLALDQHLRLSKPPPRESEEDGQTLRITLAQLREFLLCPLQGGARFHLRLDDEEEELAEREEEPFATESLLGTSLKREVLLDVLRRRARGESEASLSTAWAERAASEILRGRLPSGVFGEVEQPGHVQMLEAWHAVATEHLFGGHGPRDYEIVRFGSAQEHARVDRLVPAIVLELPASALPKRTRPLRVELHGQTSPLIRTADGLASVAFVTRALAGSGEVGLKRELQHRRASLRGFLDRVALSAAGLEPHLQHQAWEGSSEGLPRGTRFGPIPQESALAWLRVVVADLLSGPHDCFLPCEAVFCAADLAEKDAPIADSVRRVLGLFRSTGERGHESYALSYGPVRHPERFRVPDDDEAQRMMERRFGLYFAARRSEPPPEKLGPSGKTGSRKRATAKPAPAEAPVRQESTEAAPEAPSPGRPASEPALPPDEAAKPPRTRQAKPPAQDAKAVAPGTTLDLFANLPGPSTPTRPKRASRGKRP